MPPGNISDWFCHLERTEVEGEPPRAIQCWVDIPVCYRSHPIGRTFRLDGLVDCGCYGDILHGYAGQVGQSDLLIRGPAGSLTGDDVA
jgi:hypothetical protein